MSIVNGKNAILYTYHDSVWKMGACFRSISLKLSTSMLETTVSGNGAWASFAAHKHSFRGSAEGLVSLNEPGMLTLADFRALQIAKSMLLMRFQRTDPLGNLYTDECRFLIDDSTDTSSFDNLDVFTLEMQGTGAITQVFTPTVSSNTNKVNREEYTGLGGETAVNIPATAGKQIISWHKDGLGLAKIIASGTPVSKEVLIVGATGIRVSPTGDFEFAQPWQAGEEGYVLYQDV